MNENRCRLLKGWIWVSMRLILKFWISTCPSIPFQMNASYDRISLLFVWRNVSFPSEKQSGGSETDYYYHYETLHSRYMEPRQLKNSKELNWNLAPYKSHLNYIHSCWGHKVSREWCCRYPGTPPNLDLRCIDLLEQKVWFKPTYMVTPA